MSLRSAEVESGDVRALLNKFNRQAEAADASTRRDSGPAKTPSPALRTRVQPGTAPATIPENERLRHKLMPMATPQHRELASVPRLEPRGQPSTQRLPPVGVGFPRPPAPTPFSPRMLDTGRVRLADELLQNVMLNRVPGMQSPTATPAQALLPAQKPASRANIKEVTPLRRPLLPEARQPLKPRRPQQVNLEPYLRRHHPPALPLLKKNKATDKIPKTCMMTLTPWIKTESEDSEAYESIDNMQKNLPELSQKEKKKQQKEENELRKKFQLKGPPEVIHTAKVRRDCQGGKLDLAVRQGENLEILRVKDNPGGKWLARTLNGKWPVQVLHTAMVDPNGVITRPKGKQLAVAQGEILDILHWLCVSLSSPANGGGYL
ncbi:hypothetical protein CRUP_012213 [Coryphaenoides rupestris]|nr:hypothetical protein CRUP_012213 [Coryphaenoides rupestris]